MTDLTNVKPEDVTPIKVEGSSSKWNCDKCLFFYEEQCKCRAVKRLLFSRIIGEDCDDCVYPFVLKNAL